MICNMFTTDTHDSVLLRGIESIVFFFQEFMKKLFSAVLAGNTGFKGMLQN